MGARRRLGRWRQRLRLQQQLRLQRQRLRLQQQLRLQQLRLRRLWLSLQQLQRLWLWLQQLQLWLRLGARLWAQQRRRRGSLDFGLGLRRLEWLLGRCSEALRRICVRLHGRGRELTSGLGTRAARNVVKVSCSRAHALSSAPQGTVAATPARLQMAPCASLPEGYARELAHMVRVVPSVVHVQEGR